jgi:ABC-type amino acid transport substrate-binding protein
MVVPKKSEINDWPDLKGKAITTTTGGTPSIWLKGCMPDVQQMLFDNTANSLAALKQGRAVAFPQDVTLLLGLAAKDSSIKIVGHSVARGPFGIGVKLDNTEMATWANDAIQDLRKNDFFYKSLQKWLSADTLAEFSTAVPRPDHELSYAGAENLYQCN